MFKAICKQLAKIGNFDYSDKNDEGWSFVETIIVIGIGLVLTAAIGFSAARWLDDASKVTAQSDIKTLSLALNGYRLDCRHFPTQEQGLESLYTKPSTSPVPENWSGPYINSPVMNDPWGNPYIYQVPGPDGLPFEIISYGADGQEGGENKDADISSVQR